jgi:hypothetical protein
VDAGIQGVCPRCNSLEWYGGPLGFEGTPEPCQQLEGGTRGGRHTGTTLDDQRTALAWGPAPWSSPSRGNACGQAAAKPAHQRWKARLLRDSSAR